MSILGWIILGAPFLFDLAGIGIIPVLSGSEYFVGLFANPNTLACVAALLAPALLNVTPAGPVTDH